MFKPYPNPWHIIGIAVLLALAVIGYAINGFHREYLATSEYMTSFPIPKTSFPKDEPALIELDFGNGKRRMFRGAINDETYPLEIALSSAAENGKFSYRIKNGAISELAGVSGRWQVYRDGTLLQKPMQELTITGGDKYTFRYER